MVRRTWSNATTESASMNRISGQPGVVGVRGRERHGLELGDPVVAEMADGAAQRRAARRVPGPGWDAANATASSSESVVWQPAARKLKRPDLLAALDRLQQERRRSQRLAHEQVGADRRQQVCGKRSDDSVVSHLGNKKAPRRIRRKALSEERMPLRS